MKYDEDFSLRVVGPCPKPQRGVLVEKNGSTFLFFGGAGSHGRTHAGKRWIAEFNRPAERTDRAAEKQEGYSFGFALLQICHSLRSYTATPSLFGRRDQLLNEVGRRDQYIWPDL